MSNAYSLIINVIDAKGVYMRGADVLVEMLIQHGVEIVFGVPGDTSMAFHDALRLRKDKINYIICRDERDAAYTADTYARVTGKIGVVDVPSGGGALYVVPGVSEANLSNIPLLCIASEINMSSEETCALTDCNQEQLLAAVTKWNSKLKTTSLIPHMVRKAVRKSLTGAPGATALSFPENILREEYTGKPEDLIANLHIEDREYFRSAPVERDVKTLLDMINAAKKPVIIAGGGVHLSQAYAELNTFIENYAIPLASSVDGKGSINEYSPYSIGTIGANGGSPEANEVVKQADLIIVLGCKMDNVTSVGKAIINKAAKIVQVDISENILCNNINPDLPIMADIKQVLIAINALHDAKCAYSDKNSEWCTFTKGQLDSKFARVAKERERKSDKVISSNVFEYLDKYADENTVFVGDAGTPTPYISSYVRAKKAGKNFILPRAHGALGFAIGASIGAAYGRPGHKVVCAFGDSSFGMSMGELETIKRFNLPIILVNFQNDCYGWIKTIQYLYYEKNYFGVDFSPIDAVKIAEGFGIEGRHVYNNDGIEEAIKWAYSAQKPVLLNFMVESPEEYVPPVQQWEADAAKPADQRQKLVY